ncbi:hypothetical protein ACSNOU_18335 [Acinetobacter oleivorans]|uniref:hypothetical protein n=1 Tax=Acinetobacter oleivorans TaxID=1148157 RepID=UPI003F1E0E08
MMTIKADDSGFLIGERRLQEINQSMNKVEVNTHEVLELLKKLMLIHTTHRDTNSKQLNTISSAVKAMAKVKPTVNVTVNAGQSKVTKKTTSSIVVSIKNGASNAKNASRKTSVGTKSTNKSVRQINSRVKNTDRTSARDAQLTRDSNGRSEIKPEDTNQTNFTEAVKRGIDLSKLGLNVDVSHLDPTVDAVRELISVVSPAQRAFSLMGRGAMWLFRKGRPKRSEDIPRVQQDHNTEVERHNYEERKLLRKLIDAVNRNGGNNLASLLAKLGLPNLLPDFDRKGRKGKNGRNGRNIPPIVAQDSDKDKKQRRNPPSSTSETRRTPEDNKKRSRLSKLGGKLGRLAGRIPFVGSLIGGAMLASDWQEMDNKERGASVGSMVGGGIGGALGSFAGPVGSVAGATIGSWLGESIGQKVGQWTDKLQQSDIGGTIIKKWDATLDGIDKMVKGSWTTARLGMGMSGIGGGFMMASYRRGGGGGAGAGPGDGASGGTPSDYNPNNEIPITKVLETGAGYNVVELADGSIIKQEGNWNWRNRNPGNIEDGQFARSRGHVDLTDSKGGKGTKRFAAFPTMAAGRKAKKDLLFESGTYKNLDLMAAIKKYAPGNENDTAAYQRHVLKAVGANKRMGDYTPEEREKFLQAVEREEGIKKGKVTVIKPPTKTYTSNQPQLSQPKTPAGNQTPKQKKLWVSADGATPANQTKPLYVSNSPGVSPTSVPEAPNVLRRENSKPQPMLMASTASDVISQNPSDRDIVHATTGGLGARPIMA